MVRKARKPRKNHGFLRNACLRPPPLLPLTRPQSAHHRNPGPGGGLLMLLMRGGPGASSSHRFSWASWASVLMMLGLGGVPTAKNLVNTECFDFTRSNGFVPTKHTNSRTSNALEGIRGVAFGDFVGTQAFKHIKSACSRGFGWPGGGR